MNFLLIIALFKIIFIKSNKILSLYYDIDVGRPNPEFVFPKEDINYKTYFNTYLPFSIFDTDFYHLIQSQIINSTVIRYKEKYRADYYITDISIGKHIVTQFPLFLSRDSITHFGDQGIALGYHFQNEDMSVVHRLYKDKIIDNLRFAFNVDNKQGEFHFGGLPEHANIVNKGSIKIDESLPTWGFHISNIKYGGVDYKMNLPSIIHTGEYAMIYSSDVINLMINTLLKTEIEEEKCSVGTKVQYNESYFHCIEEVLIGKEIEFTFNNDMTIHLNFSSLFSNDRQSFVRSSIFPFYNFTGAFIGIQFIRLFDFVQFDFESKQVEFYSETIPITNSSSKYNLTIGIICISISSICLIMCIILFIFKVKLY